MKKPLLKKSFMVPLYPARVWVVVCDDYREGLATLSKEFSGLEGVVPFAGLCLFEGAKFGQVFVKKYLDVNTVAHEVFHLTQHILGYCSVRLDIDNHEAGAFLNGYLMERVLREVKRYLK